MNALACGTVEPLGEPAERQERRIERRRTVLAQRGVKGFPGDIFLREVRHAALGAGRHGRGNAGMARLIVDEGFERASERLGLFGCEVEPEQLQRDEPAVGGVVRAKYRAKAAGPNLMQDLERATSGRRRVVWRSVGGVQRSCSSA